MNHRPKADSSPRQHRNVFRVSCGSSVAPWPEGEPDPSALPRWARALIGVAFIVVLVAGVVWFA
jgi:hypothetical protein